MNENLELAIDWFLEQKQARPDVCTAIALLVGSLYGWPGGSFSQELLDLVRDFLNELVYDVEEWDDDNGLFVVTGHIYAADHKAAIVGRDLAPYV